jgi:hypothetical protein
MINTTASSVFFINACLFALGAILSIVRFRKKVMHIRSLSDNRDLDVYVPYNMLFYGASHQEWLSPMMKKMKRFFANSETLGLFP